MGEHEVEAVEKGPALRLVTKNPVDTVTNQNILIQNIVPSAPTDVLDAKLTLEYQMAVVVSTTNAEIVENTTVEIRPPVFTRTPDANYPEGLDYGDGLYLRGFPLQQCISSATLKLNSQPITVASEDLVDIFQTMMNPQLSKITAESGCPVGFDLGGNYKTRQTPGMVETSITEYGAGAGAATQKPIRQSSFQFQPRATASIPYIAFDGADGVGNSKWSIYIYDIVEDLIIPPFGVGNSSDLKGVSRIENLTLNITLSPLAKALSVASNMFVAGASAAGAFTNVTNVTPLSVNAYLTSLAADQLFVNQPAIQLRKPNLSITYSTPDPITAAKIPAWVSYPYNQYVAFKKTAFTGAATAASLTQSQTFVSDNIRLPNMPGRLYIGIRPTNSYLSSAGALARTTSHWLTPADQTAALSILLNTRSGLCAPMNRKDLYDMSVRNGLQMSYRQWLEGGGLLIVDLAQDLGIDPRDAAGQQVYTQLQVSLTVNPWEVWKDTATWGGITAQQPTSADFTGVAYEFYIVTETPGKIDIGNGSAKIAVVGPSQTEVLDLLSSNDTKKFVPKSEIPAENEMVGAGFNWKHHIAKGARLLAAHHDVVGNVLGKAADIFGGDMTAAGFGDDDDAAGDGGSFRKHRRVR